ncbi:phosphatidylinositol N-acetylglucosaminyltransferase subunit H-like isoform X2 [Chrysoperla carnea]|uniref:phosphatidylinositol N-acetylglucosaminyltransferase subunit H-like isoform X2 n=1 Tax=Chrysoperla carnea TaxID=189513 RepID=UPI001D05EDCC|nr:phosphatidylinositol N-acetylglucosaminyltransferase subunit H-like isoform X2 [Chrysoperla carnea]
MISNPLVTYVVLTTIIFIKLLMWFYDVKSENLLIIESVGMQITEAYPLGRTSSRFIPWHVIKDVFINEVIQLQRVIFILSILTENTSSNIGIIPVFTNTKPPLACLEIIYKSIQSTLNHFIVNASKDKLELINQSSKT